MAYNLIKKILRQGCFATNFEKYLRTPFFHTAPPVADSKGGQNLFKISMVASAGKIQLLNSSGK